MADLTTPDGLRAALYGLAARPCAFDQRPDCSLALRQGFITAQCDPCQARALLSSLDALLDGVRAAERERCIAVARSMLVSSALPESDGEVRMRQRIVVAICALGNTSAPPPAREAERLIEIPSDIELGIAETDARRGCGGYGALHCWHSQNDRAADNHDAECCACGVRSTPTHAPGDRGGGRT